MGNFRLYVGKQVIMRSRHFKGAQPFFIYEEDISPSGKLIDLCTRSRYSANTSEGYGYISIEDVEIIEIFPDER